MKNINPNCVLNREFNTSDTLKCGDELLIQVDADAVKSKKVRLTTQLSISGKYTVISIGKKGVGSSRKLSDDLRNELVFDLKKDFEVLCESHSNALKDVSFGMIIRTECKDLDKSIAKDIIIKDAKEVFDKITSVFEKAKTRSLYTKIYDVNDNTDPMESALSEAKSFLEVRGHNEYKIIEDTGIHGISGKIDELSRNKVWLKSGAFLIIEQLESFNAIDVNTGKAIAGKKNIIEKINFEAADEILRQLRLRNLTGMILIDFINMDDNKSYERLIAYMKSKLRLESVHTNFVDITGLGIMELTRNKNNKTLKDTINSLKAVDNE